MHMVKCTEKAYDGTKYKKTWMVYHDTLSLMTAHDCIEWMKTQMVDAAVDERKCLATTSGFFRLQIKKSCLDQLKREELCVFSHSLVIQHWLINQM